MLGYSLNWVYSDNSSGAVYLCITFSSAGEAEQGWEQNGFWYFFLSTVVHSQPLNRFLWLFKIQTLRCKRVQEVTCNFRCFIRWKRSSCWSRATVKISNMKHSPSIWMLPKSIPLNQSSWLLWQNFHWHSNEVVWT